MNMIKKISKYDLFKNNRPKNLWSFAGRTRELKSILRSKGTRLLSPIESTATEFNKRRKYSYNRPNPAGLNKFLKEFNDFFSKGV